MELEGVQGSLRCPKMKFEHFIDYVAKAAPAFLGVKDFHPKSKSTAAGFAKKVGAALELINSGNCSAFSLDLKTGVGKLQYLFKGFRQHYLMNLSKV